MSVTPLKDYGQKMPAAQGYAIGFADTYAACEAINHSLNAAGFPDSAIMVLEGEDGTHLLKRMLGEELWGETSEIVLKQGLIELSHGHLVLIVAAKDRDEALLAANLAAEHGGHTFSHFGVLVDEQLTR